MRELAEQFDVGVIVGRFQVHDLHEGHRELIQHVVDQHDKVIIILGLSPLPNTTNNPLDYEARKQMIYEAFPDVIVAYAHDQFSDEVWSKKLDEIIQTLTTSRQSAVLYGARDSFIAHYSGRHTTRELEPERVFSGTAVRKSITRGRTKASADFRAGVIWASASRFPTAFTAVDIAILNEDGQKVLLARKPNEGQYRFVGGFSDPDSGSFEQDARREVNEETGLDITDPVYIGSRKQEDWRYRNEQDCVKTLMFVAKRVSGQAKAMDDIEEVRWFDLHAIRREVDIISTHRPLLDMLREHLRARSTSKGA